MVKYKYLIAFLWLFILSTKIFAADYYWVGGSGNWNDINHWRTTSGGNTIPTVVPGPTDDVYFDANSGFTVTSNQVLLNVTGNCHDITFSGSTVVPTFKQNGNQILNIYGSSEWQTGMPVINIGSIYYRNTGEGKTIKSNGVITGTSTGYVYFEEENSIDLSDDFFLNGSLYHQAGTWNTNNYKVTIKSSFSAANGTKPRVINLGSSEIFLPITTGVGVININNANVTFNAGTSLIHFSPGTSPGINTHKIIARQGQTFYDVTFGGALSIGSISGGTVENPLKFHSVEFKNHGIISGYNIFEELTFTSAKNYTIEGNTIQQVSNLFSLNTVNCEGWSSLSSDTAGTSATISAPASAMITVNGVIMQDISATGGASFVATNSIDSGNNTGWSFPTALGNNLFWVGGSGNWNDKAHWSQTSGGTGGYCVPGPNDDVFFDAGSGFTSGNNTVTLDATAYTHNITFSGSAVAPTLTQSGNQTLNIYGSSEWQAGMGVNILYIYYRHTGETKTIKSNGVAAGTSTGYIYFEEETSIDLLDDFFSNASLYHQAGTWNTNNYKVTINRSIFANNGTKPRTINLGSSEIFLPYSGGSNSFNTDNAEVTLNAGTSHIHFTTVTSNNTYTNSLIGRPGHTFYDVSFEGIESKGSISGGTAANPLKFHSVQFKNNGTISGYNNFDELTFTSTKNYIIQANTIQQVNNLFSLNTVNCEGWSSLSSDTAGTSATISAPASAMITVNGVIMQDISATGGASFVATNSIDSGNNTGWSFPTALGNNLFWVGGSGNWNDKAHWSQTSGGTGGYCVPGPNDDVFFDAGSGFAAGNNTVTLDATAYTHNITFSGSTIAPTLTQSGNQTLNIYGSSEWQAGMGDVNIYNIYYRHTGDPKTIKSNGVITGATVGTSFGNIYFEEENSINLADDFIPKANLYHQAGTLNTNNHKVTITGSFYANNGNKPRVINLGSSEIFLQYSNGSCYFNTANVNLTLNAGTSHIHFNTSNNPYANSILGTPGQTFYNVSFEGTVSTGSISGGTAASPLNFNNVQFKNNGTLNGYNNFEELFFNAGKTFKLASRATQTISSWIVSGTPCNVSLIQSSSTGTQANVNVTGGNTNFNFVNIKDLNASGLALHFGEQSTNGGNNSNITFDTYNSGGFNGLGSDWNCHIIDNSNPSTYTLGTAGFYGNSFTTYKWYKLNDPNYDPTIAISTASEIDIRTYGFGTYKITVDYSDGVSDICTVSNEINISEIPQIPVASASQTLCSKQSPTVSSINATGIDLKWYDNATGNAVLPINTPLVDGQTYYVSQTIGGCESNRTPVTITLRDNCDAVMINPGMRMRVK